MKLSLMPYLLQQAWKAHKFGTPLMRPVFMEFPEDLTAWTIDTQYLLGSNLLIAPIFSKDGKVSFYVPEAEGEWVSWFDRKKRYQGGRWYREVHDYFSLPILIRPGSVTPINSSLQDSERDFHDGLELLINGPITSKVDIELVDVVHPSEVTGTISVSSTGGEINVDGSAIEKSWSVSYLGKAQSSDETKAADANDMTTITTSAGSLAFRPT